MRGVLATAVCAMMLAIAPAAGAEDAYVRVVDVGAGLCVVARSPTGETMVYDTGPRGTRCRDAVRELSPEHRVDLLVLSHSDADHIGGAQAILRDNEVRRILHPGDRRKNAATLTAVRRAIRAEPGAQIINLSRDHLEHGEVFELGAATATFIAGWSNGDQTQANGEPALASEAMRNNALSIVIRFEYGGHSVLLTGDTVGRADDSPDDACRYAEARMVEQDREFPLHSDVLIGQHHGADNASSACFLHAVSPHFVVLPAGSNGTYHHPRATAVQRMIDAGVAEENIFRTDRGDDEGGKEWRNGETIEHCNDRAGDDDVGIWLPGEPNRAVTVSYGYPFADKCDSTP